ncbi:MAG: hypothetical protein E3J72_18935 [Planctomycetota bacterium]|nr:MAG: hypothetical protein E3J72_18935 [Planctomycetota bacterium]
MRTWLLSAVLLAILVSGCATGPDYGMIRKDAEKEFRDFDEASRIREITIRDILYPAGGRLALADVLVQAERVDVELANEESRFIKKGIQIKYHRKGAKWVRCTEDLWEEVLSEFPQSRYKMQD